MGNGRKQAEIAAAAVLRILEANPGDAGIQSVSEIIELALHDAAREQEKRELQRIAEVQESAHAHLSRLLNASPAVIYCRVASGDFKPTFVSESIHRLFGCTPREYLENPYLWRDRVHPDDVPRITAWVDKMFESDERSIEYRIRRADGTYFWVNDQQQIVRNAKGEPVEIVGSWTDITKRKEAEEERETARSRLTLLLGAAPSVIYSFAASGDFAPTFVSANIAHMLGFQPGPILADARLLAVSRSSRRPRRGRGEAGRAVQKLRALGRVPLPQERRLLHLGDGRATPHPRPSRQPRRGGRLLERYRRPQGGRARS